MKPKAKRKPARRFVVGFVGEHQCVYGPEHRCGYGTGYCHRMTKEEAVAAAKHLGRGSKEVYELVPVELK